MSMNNKVSLQQKRKEIIRELDKSINSNTTNLYDMNELLAENLFALDLTVYSKNNSFDSLIYSSFAQSVLDEKVVLHPEQVEIINLMKEKEALIISAPTSFGKTFCIFEYIAQVKPRNIVLIVPTLALVEEYLKRIIKKYQNVFRPYKVHTQLDMEFIHSSRVCFIIILTKA